VNRLVLTVDDKPVNLRLMGALLRSSRCRQIVAGDGETALSIAREQQPKLILMDIELPGMDGLETTRRLKGDPQTSHIPVIALTAFAMVGDRERALEAGCDEYVPKPVDTRRLAELVERAVAA
jgi:two-component system, cell cycle response regulator DivK